MRQNKRDGVDGDADALWLDVAGVGLGATNAEIEIRKRIVLSQELEKWEKEAVLMSVWLKESY